MGVNSKDLRLLLKLAERGLIKRRGKIVEIGAQQLSNDFLRARNLVQKAESTFAAEHAFKLAHPQFIGIGVDGIELQSDTMPFARDFWTALGFTYAAIDVDGSPDSIALDLNVDEVPRTLRSEFDLVTNLGTTEHVCNQLNAFKVIHDLAAPGAVMIHHLPGGGGLDHGLFNYNPKFFWVLARSNDYGWLYADYSGGPDLYDIPKDIRDFVSEYEPAAAAQLSVQKIGTYSIQIAFKKLHDIPFVPPIDVPTGTKASNAELKWRYWTVFQPNLLEAVKSGRAPAELEALFSTNEVESDGDNGTGQH